MDKLCFHLLSLVQMYPLATDLIEEQTWVIESTTVEFLFHPQRFPARMTIISGIFENRYGIKHGKRAFQQSTFYHYHSNVGANVLSRS
jgi:hypothetical protein